ncbi:MAG: bifunctional glutamate N-acetyltransferase/amino-acid acetyltransferase ArgJ [Clostridiales bacterium]|jgi:glutamate N-acetyltransferase/amino-acid N-acetyltransferase|nr:bifunctional glutamate N-acetyltransferase/amino-acid acetyltransferase ArgJ [Clostridiales bacterium]
MPNHSINAPAGFLAAGDHIGIKKQKKDLTLILSEKPAAAAGCFTQNIVKAAPVQYDLSIIHSGKKVRGIVVNSGNANACTGEQGLKDVKAAAGTFAALAGCESDDVLVCSTGVIGVNLPMDTLLPGIGQVFAQLGKDEVSGGNAAQGIMTTDMFAKTAYEEVSVGGITVKLAGMAKGSAMIHPNMATLLAFITTDAAISVELLQKALAASVRDSYNMISVDRDTSTNDTALILANGMSGNTAINAEGDDFNKFSAALHRINKKLAIDMARDGEGATKLMEVNVYGAASDSDARIIARSVTSSNLFKAALFGSDANWGRILCAMGYSGGKFDPNHVSVNFRSSAGSIDVLKNGSPVLFDEARAKTILSEKEICVDIRLTDGGFSAAAWGCDLTYDYVKINGDYRS